MAYSDRGRYPYPPERSYRRAPSGRRRRSGQVSMAAPAFLALFGLLCIAAVFLCAWAGVFDNPAPVNSVSHYTAAAVIDRMEPTEAMRIIRRRRVGERVAAMTTEQKVGQLLLLRSHEIIDNEFFAEISDTHAGGVVLFGNDIKGKDADQLTAYIQKLQQSSDGSMLICVDEEGGSVVRVSSNRKLRSGSFRSPQKLYAEGGMELITSDAVEKAQFLRGFGFNVNFAPVADVVTQPKAMMYDRALGADAAATAEYVRRVVEASEREGVATCLKHFPGYGNTTGDTHNGVVRLDTSLEQLRENDFLPFLEGIDAGCGAIMITHTVMTGIDPDLPASMSPAVIDLLRSELGFEGVTISDGLDMGAIRAYSGDRNVCVSVFLAGVDLMCTPGDGRAAHAALLQAVNDGTITLEKLDEAVSRIVGWKMDMGLYGD